MQVKPDNPSTPPFDIHTWRKKFPLLDHTIHVANCSQSPQSDATRQAALDYLENWNTVGMDWDRWIAEINLAKSEFARLIGAKPDDIAVGSSVSELTSALAGALSFQGKRTKVAVTNAEFPTVGHVWLAQQKFGAEVQFIPVGDGIIDPAEYDRVVDEETIITSVCDVYYYNGFKQDLADVIPRIHAKGSLVYVDAYQGLGTHPLNVRKLDIDFLASGNLKYLLGTPGIAFLYVKADKADMLRPAFTGWFSQENPFAFDIHRLDFARTARRMEGGTPPILPAYVARAGMQIINSVGVENIQRWTDHLSKRCITGALNRNLEVVSPRDLRMKGPNTAIRVSDNSHVVEEELKKRNIIASARADVIRIAPHFFTGLEDIDAVLDALADILKP